MSNLYALLVGINEYASPDVRNLLGCRNDIEDAIAFLEQRRAPDTTLYVETLLDDEATGAAILAGLRHHLANAGPDDTALFWFSGHGSTEPVPGRYWHLEPNGRFLQTLVCADSRVDGRPELLDKELAVLLDEVAAGGCHLVVVLDSCHAGGATRGISTVRSVPPAAQPSAYDLIPDLAERYAVSPPRARHVLLAACQPQEEAAERFRGGVMRGSFSWALLRAMRRAGRTTSYRELVSAARTEIEKWSARQRPLIFPAGPGVADRRFLGGTAIADPPTLVLQRRRGEWEVNAGAAHAVELGGDADRTRFAVAGEPALEVRATEVRIARTLVEPIGWEPDQGRTYPLVVSHAAVPATVVGIDDDVDPAVGGRIRDAIGAANPHLRLADVAQADLIVGAPRGPSGRLPLTDGDRRPLWELDASDSAWAAADLEHIARWRRVKDRRNPVSQLKGAVSIEMVERRDEYETVVPRDRAATPPDADGSFRLAYRWEHGEWTPPSLFVRLRNHGRDPLHCVLLDLTERFRIDAGLFRGERVEPGVTAVAEGAPIHFHLPEDIPVAPGTSYTDWLMLIVSTDEIDPFPYEMPPLTRERSREVSTGRVPRPRASDWWTTVLPVVTTVPAE